MNKDSSIVDTARVLSEFAYGLTFDSIPEYVLETVKLFIADYYASSFAGKFINKQFNESVLDLINTQGSVNASILGTNLIISVENAAFMNAVYAHGADMDDGNRKAMGHIAAHVMSAVFSLAETLDSITWKEVVTAIIVGYEVYNRIAAMAQPGLVHRGFHSTGTAGSVACAAACAKLLGLDTDGIYSSIGISAIQSSGLIIIAESGQACKPLNPANAARIGILSAKLAQKGINGPAYPLESQKGWFHAMSDNVKYEMMTGLGKEYTICESYLKLYPSCRHTHCGIDAAKCIHDRMIIQGITVNDIEKVELYIYQNAITIAGQIKEPETIDEAKFSIHYSLAIALLYGGFTLQDLNVRSNAHLQGLISKIELVPDDNMEIVSKGIRGAKLVVRLTNGETMEETVLLPKGEAANPLSWDDIIEKMTSCTQSTHYLGEMIVHNIKSIDYSQRYLGINSILN